jgi:hypothetical protein
MARSSFYRDRRTGKIFYKPPGTPGAGGEVLGITDGKISVRGYDEFNDRALTLEETEQYQNELRQAQSEDIDRRGGAPVGTNAAAADAGQSAELGASMANKQYDPDELLQELLAELKAPIDWNDPEFASILAQSENSAERRARQAGIEGPMSIGATQAAGTNARTALQGQRNERYDHALGLASQRSLSKEQFDIQRQRLEEDQYQYDAGMGMNQSQGQGSFWGGLLGAGASIAGHLINPAGGFLGQLGNFAQGGASLGSGFAGSYGRPPARNSYRRGGGGY